LKGSKIVRIVSPTSGDCRNTERPLHWSITGPSGTQGAVGATGPQGVPGLAGAPGAAGAQGPAGGVGAAGPQGPTGAVGAPGAAGAAGAPGAAGAAGVDGNVFSSQIFRPNPILAFDGTDASASAFYVTFTFKRGTGEFIEHNVLTHAFSVLDGSFTVKLTASHYVISSFPLASDCIDSTACKIRVVAFNAETLARQGVLGCFTIDGSDGSISGVSLADGGVGTVTDNPAPVEDTATLVLPDVAGLYHLMLDATDTSLNPTNDCSSPGDWHVLNVRADSAGLISVQ
jgi:Collagen triple helix repeat (20 copies)